LLVICILVRLPFASGDAIIRTRAMTASTIAEIFITDDSVRVELEIGAQDLPGFRNIMPDEAYERLGFDPVPFEERLERFFTEDLVLRPDDGAPLHGAIQSMGPRQRVKRDEITGEPLPVEGDEEIVVFAELRYPLQTRPRTLSIRPPVEKDTGMVGATIGFVVYHDEVPVTDFRYLSAEEVLDLDWDDPWYSRFRNRNLKRQYDAPLSAFLYVEHFEVRKEIIARPKDLQQWLDLELEGKDVIPAADQQELKDRVAAFLIDRGTVTVDGELIDPELDRIHFVRRTLRTTGIIDPPEDLDLTSATLGIIFVYPIAELPQEVTLDWDLFSPRIQKVYAAATDEAGGMPYTLAPDDKVLRWQNFLTNPTIPGMMAFVPPAAPPQVTIPLVTGLCAALLLAMMISGMRRMRRAEPFPRGLVAACVIALVCSVVTVPYARTSFAVPFSAPRITEQNATPILSGLLQNIYRAFDRREESLVYDRLALSISGDLLSEVYLQTRRSMELENQGGARVKVDTVDVLQAVPQGTTDTEGFIYRCRWNVSGSVGHWGHLHRRTNQYDAVFTVEPIEGAWRISAMDVIEEKRLGTSPVR
jgi:hypothetical protein